MDRYKNYNMMTINICKPELEPMKGVKQRKLEAIKMIVLHHSACENESVYDIDTMHRKRGFSGIGYHYYIEKDGTIWQGRPITQVGAHCKGHNSASVGICIAGDLRYREATPLQLRSCIKLIAYLNHKLGTNLALKLHRELSSTICPARDLICDMITVTFKDVLIEEAKRKDDDYDYSEDETD